MTWVKNGQWLRYEQTLHSPVLVPRCAPITCSARLLSVNRVSEGTARAASDLVPGCAVSSAARSSAPTLPALVLSLAQRTRTPGRLLVRIAMRRGCSEILLPSHARRHTKSRADRLIVTICATSRHGPVVTPQPAPRSSAMPSLWSLATPSLRPLATPSAWPLGWPLATPFGWPFPRPFGWPFPRRKRGHCRIFGSAKKFK